MILPDSRCEIHGEEFALYFTMSRGQPVGKKYCRSCKREGERARAGGLRQNSPLNPRCRNGHPKTPFNYGLYGGIKRCRVCARERGRRKR